MSFPGAPEDLRLYGVIRIIDGSPVETYCCELRPSVWVESVGWDTSDEEMNQEMPVPEYHPRKGVENFYSGDPFDVEFLDDAMEEAAANWN